MEDRNTPTERAPEFSIVMPCLDEAETLEVCLEKARQGLAECQVEGEIIVADNGSTDGSQEIAIRWGARVVPVTDRGYGSALRGGIAAARGKFIIMGDADDSYDFSKLENFVTHLREGFDLVMGNRFLGGIQRGAMPPLHRFLGNPILTGIGRLLFKSPCGDFHCGLRAFRRDAILKMDLQTTGMEFASEMVVKATLQGLRIKEVPTTLSVDGRSRPPHLRSWRDGWLHLRFLLLFCPRWLFFYPGIFLMLAGFIGGLWIISDPQFQILGVSALAYAVTSVLLGFQSFLFSLLTTIYANQAGLLPESPTLRKFYRVIRLEVGLAIGAICILCGLAGTVYVVGDWSQKSFGAMDPLQSLPIVLPACLALAVGFQIILSSFFFSLLGLGRKQWGTRETEERTGEETASR